MGPLDTPAQENKAKQIENKKQDYVIHIRIDPKESRYARMIVEYSISCKEQRLYEKIATLEAFLQLKDLLWNHYTIKIVEIEDSGGYGGWSDEYSSLNPEQRKRINQYLPKMLKKNEETLKKIVEKEFVSRGGIHYIG